MLSFLLNPKMRKFGTIVSCLGTIFVMGGNALNGQVPTSNEVVLALSALGAAVGWQKK